MTLSPADLAQIKALAESVLPKYLRTYYVSDLPPTDASVLTWSLARGRYLSAVPAGGVTLGAPAFTLGTTNVAGAAGTAPATDSTIAIFDATVPVAIGTATHGTKGFAADAGHIHAGVRTNLTGGNWKVDYTDGSGVVTELTVGAAHTFFKFNGATNAPTAAAILAADLPAAAYERAFTLGKAGAIPVTTAQFADFSFPSPWNCTILRMTVVMQPGGGVSLAGGTLKTIQLRVAHVADYTSWSNVTGFVVSLDSAVNGGLYATITPAAQTGFLSTDIFQLSTTDANAASGTNPTVTIAVQLV